MTSNPPAKGPKRIDDRGMISTELALCVPIVILGFVSLLMFGGRVVQAETDVQAAAQEAARAATLHSRYTAAAEQASQIAAENLRTSGLSCAAGGPDVRTTSSSGLTDLQPGATVSVSVTCVADLRALTHLRIAPTMTFNATAHEIVDVYRSSP